MGIDQSLGSGYEVTLLYPGWSVVFLTRAGQIDFGENVRIYLGDTPALLTQTLVVRRWRGFVTLKPP